MCACAGIIKINNQGKVRYGYLLFIAAFTVLLGYAVMENRMVVHVRDRVDNVLTVSCFSGTLCDFHRMRESMTTEKYVQDGRIYYDFEAMYQGMDIHILENNLNERICAILGENIFHDGVMRELISGYSLDELILYQDFPDGSVTAPNGVTLNEPGIYIKLKINIKGILGKIHTVYQDKCVVVRIK